MKNTETYPFADRYIDLHLHLDGAITPEIARKLAKLQDFPLPENDDKLKYMLTVSEACADLNEFLARFSLPISLLKTPAAIREAVHLMGDNVLSQGVVYAEFRFAPQSHTQKGMTQEDAVKAALEGLSETELKANLILCCMRGIGNEKQNFETIRLAKKYLVEDGGVTAVDLAGAEALFPTENYRDLFAMARAYGIPFTIHAGEAAGPESVRAAVEFGAKRIGHGIRIFTDPDTVRFVKDNGITLEICPTSNRQTRAVHDMKDFPLMDFLQKGIKVTINTDDMGIEGITLADEFRYLEKEFHLTGEQERQILSYAVDAAFTSEQVKKELREKLNLQ